MKTAIIVCARLASRRVPNKCAIQINGKSILHHLHDRLRKTGLQIIYAVPAAESSYFTQLIDGFDGAEMYIGHDEDPLARMYHAAKAYNVDLVVRVTHDKIFVDTDSMFRMIDEARRFNLHYVYGSGLMAGTGCEVIAFTALEEAAAKYKKVEHVSYAIRTVTERQLDMRPAQSDFIGHRLLIDFPEDLELMKRIFGILGNDCDLEEVQSLLLNNPWLAEINEMPVVTVYTCAYNAEKWLDQCMGSVAMQKRFNDHEYLLIDDCSTDKTALLMSKFSSKFPNTKYIRNAKNLGLASSSNVALENARGRYVVRLDADDYFTTPEALNDLVHAIIHQKADVIYPSNYFGKHDYVQMGKDAHHIGGALFRTRAINHIKFTEGLRGYEGYDFFKRAQTALKIGYLNRPIFMYRQHEDSMSKTNLEERARIKAEIDQRHTGAETTQGG